jgi:hypothetical protein
MVSISKLKGIISRGKDKKEQMLELAFQGNDLEIFNR